MKACIIYLSLIGLGAMISCGAKQSNEQRSEPTAESTVSFNADSAYLYVKRQVEFGARVPNTAAHGACADYLVTEMNRLGATSFIQKGEVRAYDGTLLKIQNIISVIRPELPERILLFAHWDSRPFADHDPDPANHRKPIMGANDGASGVGVLMEVARQLQIKAPQVGVDIIFFDAEDYGTPEFDTLHQSVEDTWCLGSQYWAKTPHEIAYSARFGILLDMVGGKDPKFFREQVSDYFAKSTVNKVWNAAKKMGFSAHFINRSGGGVTDDHLYVNQILGIPSIDIIDHDSTREKGFPDSWHTLSDTMEQIDPASLRMVGLVVLDVIYNEK